MPMPDAATLTVTPLFWIWLACWLDEQRHQFFLQNRIYRNVFTADILTCIAGKAQVELITLMMAPLQQLMHVISYTCVWLVTVSAMKTVNSTQDCINGHCIIPEQDFRCHSSWRVAEQYQNIWRINKFHTRTTKECEMCTNVTVVLILQSLHQCREVNI